MKIALRFLTAIGPRTVIADTPDAVSAKAIVNAHLASGGYAEFCDPTSNLTVKQILARRKPKKRIKPTNVIPLNNNSWKML